MRVSIPFSYYADATPVRGSLSRNVGFMETADFELREVDERDAPIATAWTTRSDQTRHHTRFWANSHWYALSRADQVIFRSLQAYPTSPWLLAEAYRANGAFKVSSSEDRIFRLVRDAGGRVAMGTGHEVVWGDSVRAFEIASSDTHRQAALLKARCISDDLMYCDGLFYKKAAEPTLQLILVNEKRPPNTLRFAVAPTGETPGYRETALVEYEHRLDRENDFEAFLGEAPFPGEHDFERTIESIEIWLPETLKLDDDRQCLRQILEVLRDAIGTADPLAIDDNALEFYRGSNIGAISDEAMETILVSAADTNSRFLAGVKDAQNLRQRTKACLERWAMKPLSVSRDI